MLSVIVSVSISKCVKFDKEIKLLGSPKMANIFSFLQGFRMTSFFTMSNYIFSLGRKTVCKNTFFFTEKLKHCVINSWLVFILFLTKIFIFLGFLVWWFGVFFVLEFVFLMLAFSGQPKTSSFQSNILVCFNVLR